LKSTETEERACGIGGVDAEFQQFRLVEEH